MKVPSFLLTLAVLTITARAQTISLQTALDSVGLTWSSGGSASWNGQTNVTHDSVDAAQSGFIAGTQESWVETTVVGPGKLVFWWKVSSEEGFDLFRFLVGGVEELSISGEVGWQQKSVLISSGSRSVRWRYTKDNSFNGGQDKGWLDQVTFIPDPPNISEQPQNQTVIVGSNATFNVTASGPPPLVYQWRLAETNLIYATNASYNITGVLPGNAGNYSVVVSNGGGTVTSGVATLTVVVPPPCVPVPSGLISWWAAEDTAADVANRNSGSLVGTAFAPGLVGRAFSFDGISSYIDVPASASMDATTNTGLTIECWIKPDDLTIPRPLADWNDGINLGAHFWISEPWFDGQGGPGALFANLIDTGGGTHALVSTPGRLNTNSFQHVAVTYDRASGIGSLYINGSTVYSADLGDFTPQTSLSLFMGQRSAGLPTPAFYSGLMDEVGLYNRALSSQEIFLIYLGGANGKCAGPELRITRNGAAFVLSWPSWANAFVVEETKSVATSPISWNDSQVVTNTVPGFDENSVIITNSLEETFFRLRRQ